MIVFNIEKYGDFDMPYTALVMAAPEGMTKAIASTLAKEAESVLKDTANEQDAVTYLKGWGFTHVKSYDVPIGGNL